MNLRVVALAAALGLSAALSAQQQSPGYKFLEAVRESNAAEVTKMLDQPGTTVVNTRSYESGEGALHITVKRGDGQYSRFLIGRGADVDMRDDRGVTPLLLAANAGQADMVELLIERKANANLANKRGETPLILAVQRGNSDIVRTLLAAGADPDQADYVAGLSARDYAKQERRPPAVARLIDETPKRVRRAVSGPKL